MEKIILVYVGFLEGVVGQGNPCRQSTCINLKRNEVKAGQNQQQEVIGFFAVVGRAGVASTPLRFAPQILATMDHLATSQC